MNRFESWVHYESKLDLVEHQTYSDIEQQSSYHYHENCPYQMAGGVVRRISQLYPAYPEPYAQIDITVQFVPKETT